MRAMKDSGVEWLGEIPAGWSLRLAAQLANPIKTPNFGLKETNLLSLSYGKIRRRDIDSSDGLVPASFETYNIIEKDDIVLRFTDLQNDQKSLRVGRATERGIVTSAYVSVRPIDCRDSRFMYYALHAYDLRKGFYGMGAGVRQGLKWQEAKYIRLPWPSRPTRERIADYLDEKCIEIDRAVKAAEESIGELLSYEVSVIDSATSAGISKDIGLKAANAATRTVNSLVWKAIRMKHLYRVVSITNHPNEELLSVYLKKGVIRYADSDGKQVHKPSGSLAKYQLVQPGNLVLNNQQAWRGSVGVSRFRGIVSPAYVVLEKTATSIDDSYMNFFFRGPFVPVFGMCSRGVGSIQRNISTGELMNQTIFIPPFDEQRRIAEYLEEKCSQIDCAVATKQAIIADLKAYKQSLIYETVTGKREV